MGYDVTTLAGVFQRLERDIHNVQTEVRLFPPAHSHGKRIPASSQCVPVRPSAGHGTHARREDRVGAGAREMRFQIRAEGAVRNLALPGAHDVQGHPSGEVW